MTKYYPNAFAQDSYLHARPDLRARLAAGELKSAYQHLMTTCEDAELTRYELTQPDPTVSVVMPAHNAAEYIQQSLASVMAQSYHAWECIVVDDFSSDDTAMRIKRLIRSDSRIKLVSHRANGGPNAARNTGIRSARGTFICFLDSDDLLMEYSLENRVSAIAKADTERLVGSYSASRTIDASVRVPPREARSLSMEIVDFTHAGGQCPFNANQPMFKTAVLRLLGGFDETMRQAEDWEFWQRILRHGYHLVPTDIVDVTYRTHATSNIRSNPAQHLKNGMSVYQGAHQALPEEKIWPDSPFVNQKQWLAYKQQLDLAPRVLEFSGMAVASGQAKEEALGLIRDTIPDYLGAISQHRELEVCLERGMKRQSAGSELSADEVRASAKLLVEEIEETLRAQPTTKMDSSLYPKGLGPTPADHRSIDVVFLPHKDYHVWSFSLILGHLDEAGIRYTFVDPTYVYRDEGARSKLDELGLPYVSFNTFLLGDFRPKLVVTTNDWDPINKRIIESCRALGIPTVGVVEGVQDYLDVDTGRVRSAYQTVEYVLLPGEFDARYFPPDSQKVRVGGVPRIDELCAEEPRWPERPFVVINSNFTYNVLTECRDEWVRLAVEACESLGYDYAVSRHPADQGDFSNYNVATESMYELIRRGSVFVSRFGSGILESLAMGKPAIYLNSHGEKIDKFSEPNGAFPVARNRESLVSALRETVETPERYMSAADDYVALHCGFSRKPGSLAASARLGRELVDIFTSAPMATDEQRSRLKYLMIHREEMLVGPIDFAETDDNWAAKLKHRHAQVRKGLSGTALEEQKEKVLRRYRKFQRDPKSFLEDSRHRSLNLLSKVL